MRLLLDTQTGTVRSALEQPDSDPHGSVATLWEIGIKVRLGKLPLQIRLDQLPEALRSYGLQLLSIQASHVLAEVEPQPATRDPFDRLLLAQCLVENMRLVTLDRVLAAHPLAWRPG